MLFDGVIASALTIGYAVVLGQALRMTVQYQIWLHRWRQPERRTVRVSGNGEWLVPPAHGRAWLGVALVVGGCAMYLCLPGEPDLAADVFAKVMVLLGIAASLLLIDDGWRMPRNELRQIRQVRGLVRFTRKLLEQHSIRERLSYPDKGEPPGAREELDRLLALLDAEPWERSAAPRSWRVVTLLLPTVEQSGESTIRLMRYRYGIRSAEQGAHIWDEPSHG
ncbi:hypothetical protein AB0B66_12375 [Catellatospora sp. NPDC049111]|uniref:hypothetical protein n=1 Tax=Catellatospora sp. NPDC049111 TaxID=3155271 RepID=UPI0033BFE1B0